MKIMDIEELNQLYDQAERVDEEIFREMRSNLLLVQGNHYTKRTSKFFARLRNTNKLSEVQKLRITKNHIHKISRYYQNNLMAKVPGVMVAPQNDVEMQDKKAAELNQAVWEYMKDKYDLKRRKRRWAKDFVDIGEVCTKIYWDPNAGDLIGYAPKMIGEGEYEYDEKGEMIADEEQPIFSGAFEYEPIQGYNLLRSPFAKCMEDSPYLIVRKMVDKNLLKKLYAGDKDKLSYIQESEKETYVIFESHKAHYSPNETEILVKEYYYKPCLQYPNGYFYITTQAGILEQDELPNGIYPLVWEGFDEYASTPRAHSIIKIARPYQAEINRAASQMATHQITVGDDKIIYQSGTKLAPGALLPGVRGLTYQGTPPQILAGREGGQFLPYIESQIREMYQACMLEEVLMEENQGQMDPYTLLFRSASQQQKFSQYTEKFENFLKKVCEKSLELARYYLPDDVVVQAVGKSEAVNIAEFKNAHPRHFFIKVEQQTETLDSKLGRQLALNHVLQYVGQNLDQESIGRILKEMPYLNNDYLAKDLTINQENVENDMLALERGEMPDISPYAENEYYVKRLSHRMKQADFRMLNGQIQQNYVQFMQIHEQEIARKQQAIMDAKNEYIPVGGAMITCQMHLPDPKDPTKTKQVRVPYQALDWLIKMLEKQGMNQDKLEAMNEGALSEIAGMVNQNQQAQMGAQGASMGQQGFPGAQEESIDHLVGQFNQMPMMQ
jgi:hypothetical protein